MYVTSPSSDGKSSQYWYAAEEENRSEIIGRRVKVSYATEQSWRQNPVPVNVPLGTCNLHFRRMSFVAVGIIDHCQF